MPKLLKVSLASNLHKYRDCKQNYFLGDHCQYWLNETDGSAKLTSPNYPNLYHFNLNCGWSLYTDQGFYITLEITVSHYGVKNIIIPDITFKIFLIINNSIILDF